MAKVKQEVSGVPALIVTPEKAPVVTGNFEQIESYLQKWRKQVSKMEITESSMEQARLIKKEAVAYRNSLTKIQTDIKRTYFNDPKAIFEAKMAQLLCVVGEVEQDVDRVLEIEEKERIACINEGIDSFIEKFQEQYNLDPDRVMRIERKKPYYNKTTDEKTRKDDIEQQFKELKKEQDAYAANIRLIQATCKDEPRINTQHWLDQLQYEDVATITEAIIAEKQRLSELDKQAEISVEEETSATSSSAVVDADYEVVGQGGVEKITIGVPGGINFISDFKGRTRSMTVKLVYPCDLGDALTQLFTELRQYGIKVRPVKTDAGVNGMV